MANKVLYGLSQAAYAVASFATDGTVSYNTPVSLPGSVSLSLNAQGDLTTFRADNMDYWTSQSNTGYQGDYEIAKLPDSFYTDILKAVNDLNGLNVEVVDPDTVHFAFLFQVEGDKNAVRHVLYNCTAGRPSVAGNTTADTIEPNTQTVQITAHPIDFATLNKPVIKARAESATASTAYTNWFTAVQTPAASV